MKIAADQHDLCEFYRVESIVCCIESVSMNSKLNEIMMTKFRNWNALEVNNNGYSATLRTHTNIEYGRTSIYV